MSNIDLNGITSLRFGAKLRYENGTLYFGEEAGAPAIPLSTSQFEATPPAELDLAALQAYYELQLADMMTPEGRAAWTGIKREEIPCAVTTLSAILDRLGHEPEGGDDGSLYALRRAMPLNDISGMFSDGSSYSLLAYAGYDPERDSAVFTMPCVAKMIRDDRGTDETPRDPAVIRALDGHVRFEDSRIYLGNDDTRGTPVSIWDNLRLCDVAETDTDALQAFYGIVLEEAAKPEILADLCIRTVFRVGMPRLLEQLGFAGKISKDEAPKYVKELIDDLGQLHGRTYEVSACFLMSEGCDPETDTVSFTAPCLVDWIIGKLVASGRTAV